MLCLQLVKASSLSHGQRSRWNGQPTELVTDYLGQLGLEEIRDVLVEVQHLPRIECDLLSDLTGRDHSAPPLHGSDSLLLKLRRPHLKNRTFSMREDVSDDSCEVEPGFGLICGELVGARAVRLDDLVGPAHEVLLKHQ